MIRPYLNPFFFFIVELPRNVALEITANASKPALLLRGTLGKFPNKITMEKHLLKCVGIGTTEWLELDAAKSYHFEY